MNTKKMMNDEIKKLKKEDLLILAEEILKKYKKEDLVNFILNSNKDKVNTIKFEVVDETGIVEQHSNNGKTKTVLYKVGKIFWKLIIHSESYSFQSYIKLYSSSTLDNWSLIKKGNPKTDYNIDIAYGSYTPQVFDGIIKDYKEIIKKMC